MLFGLSASSTFAADPKISETNDDESSLKLPAVSGVNGKVSVGGGSFDSFDAGFIEGSLSFPLSHSTGLQFDGLVGGGDGSTLSGGAHLFWRDPSVGLVGLYGGMTDVDIESTNYTHYAVGVEAAAYLDRFSIEALFGSEGGDDVEEEFFNITNFAYYPTDDLRLYAGYRYIQEESKGAAGLEYQFSSTNTAGAGFFAETRFDGDDTEFWGGLRIYLGKQKSLIRRHREDDPSNPSLDFLFEEVAEHRGSSNSGSNSDSSPSPDPTPAPEPTPGPEPTPAPEPTPP